MQPSERYVLLPEKFSEKQFMDAFARYEDDLRAYGRSLLPSWDSVEETLQEASIIMWRKIDQLETIDEFLPWAKVILRFEALKSKRNYARERLVFSDSLIELLANEGIEDSEEVDQTHAALQKCLQLFSAANRELVLAPYLSDQSIVKIAKMSGRTENSLYKLIGRLRLKLRKCIQSEILGGMSHG